MRIRWHSRRGLEFKVKGCDAKLHTPEQADHTLKSEGKSCRILGSIMGPIFREMVR
jgi:hypothetical protein